MLHENMEQKKNEMQADFLVLIEKKKVKYCLEAHFLDGEAATP